tara:strand:- start:845 stop:1039 length:195 start_codon:yes stop_codon:yes gene_type:complete
MKNALFSLIRHVLVAGATLVVAKNPSIDLVPIVSGILGLFGAAWGVSDEYIAEKKNARQQSLGL